MGQWDLALGKKIDGGCGNRGFSLGVGAKNAHGMSEWVDAVRNGGDGAEE